MSYFLAVAYSALVLSFTQSGYREDGSFSTLQASNNESYFKVPRVSLFKYVADDINFDYKAAHVTKCRLHESSVLIDFGAGGPLNTPDACRMLEDFIAHYVSHENYYEHPYNYPSHMSYDTHDSGSLKGASGRNNDSSSSSKTDFRSYYSHGYTLYHNSNGGHNSNGRILLREQLNLFARIVVVNTQRQTVSLITGNRQSRGVHKYTRDRTDNKGALWYFGTDRAYNSLVIGTAPVPTVGGSRPYYTGHEFGNRYGGGHGIEYDYPLSLNSESIWLPAGSVVQLDIHLLYPTVELTQYLTSPLYRDTLYHQFRTQRFKKNKPDEINNNEKVPKKNSDEDNIDKDRTGESGLGGDMVGVPWEKVCSSLHYAFEPRAYLHSYLDYDQVKDGYNYSSGAYDATTGTDGGGGGAYDPYLSYLTRPLVYNSGPSLHPDGVGTRIRYWLSLCGLEKVPRVQGGGDVGGPQRHWRPDDTRNFQAFFHPQYKEELWEEVPPKDSDGEEIPTPKESNGEKVFEAYELPPTITQGLASRAGGNIHVQQGAYASTSACDVIDVQNVYLENEYDGEDILCLEDVLQSSALIHEVHLRPTLDNHTRYTSRNQGRMPHDWVTIVSTRGLSDLVVGDALNSKDRYPGQNLFSETEDFGLGNRYNSPVDNKKNNTSTGDDHSSGGGEEEEEGVWMVGDRDDDAFMYYYWRRTALTQESIYNYTYDDKMVYTDHTLPLPHEKSAAGRGTDFTLSAPTGDEGGGKSTEGRSTSWSLFGGKNKGNGQGHRSETGSGGDRLGRKQRRHYQRRDSHMAEAAGTLLAEESEVYSQFLPMGIKESRAGEIMDLFRVLRGFGNGHRHRDVYIPHGNNNNNNNDDDDDDDDDDDGACTGSSGAGNNGAADGDDYLCQLQRAPRRLYIKSMFAALWEDSIGIVPPVTTGLLYDYPPETPPNSDTPTDSEGMYSSASSTTTSSNRGRSTGKTGKQMSHAGDRPHAAVSPQGCSFSRYALPYFQQSLEVLLDERRYSSDATAPHMWRVVMNDIFSLKYIQGYSPSTKSRREFTSTNVPNEFVQLDPVKDTPRTRDNSEDMRSDNRAYRDDRQNMERTATTCAHAFPDRLSPRDRRLLSISLYSSIQSTLIDKKSGLLYCDSTGHANSETLTEAQFMRIVAINSSYLCDAGRTGMDLGYGRRFLRESLEKFLLLVQGYVPPYLSHGTVGTMGGGSTYHDNHALYLNRHYRNRKRKVLRDIATNGHKGYVRSEYQLDGNNYKSKDMKEGQNVPYSRAIHSQQLFDASDDVLFDECSPDAKNRVDNECSSSQEDPVIAAVHKLSYRQGWDEAWAALLDVIYTHPGRSTSTPAPTISTHGHPKGDSSGMSLPSNHTVCPSSQMGSQRCHRTALYQPHLNLRTSSSETHVLLYILPKHMLLVQQIVDRWRKRCDTSSATCFIYIHYHIIVMPAYEPVYTAYRTLQEARIQSNEDHDSSNKQSKVRSRVGYDNGWSVGSSSPFSSDSVSIYRSDYREEKENYGSYNYQGSKVSTDGSEVRKGDADADEKRERVLEDDEEYSLPSLRLCLLAAEDIVNRATVHNDIIVHLRGLSAILSFKAPGSGANYVIPPTPYGGDGEYRLAAPLVIGIEAEAARSIYDVELKTRTARDNAEVTAIQYSCNKGSGWDTNAILGVSWHFRHMLRHTLGGSSAGGAAVGGGNHALRCSMIKYAQQYAYNESVYSNGSHRAANKKGGVNDGGEEDGVYYRHTNLHSVMSHLPGVTLDTEESIFQGRMGEYLWDSMRHTRSIYRAKEVMMQRDPLNREGQQGINNAIEDIVDIRDSNTANSTHMLYNLTYCNVLQHRVTSLPISHILNQEELVVYLRAKGELKSNESTVSSDAMIRLNRELISKTEMRHLRKDLYFCHLQKAKMMVLAYLEYPEVDMELTINRMAADNRLRKELLTQKGMSVEEAEQTVFIPLTSSEEYNDNDDKNNAQEKKRKEWRAWVEKYAHLYVDPFPYSRFRANMHARGYPSEAEDAAIRTSMTTPLTFYGNAVLYLGKAYEKLQTAFDTLQHALDTGQWQGMVSASMQLKRFLCITFDGSRDPELAQKVDLKMMEVAHYARFHSLHTPLYSYSKALHYVHDYMYTHGNIDHLTVDPYSDHDDTDWQEYYMSQPGRVTPMPGSSYSGNSRTTIAQSRYGIAFPDGIFLEHRLGLMHGSEGSSTGSRDEKSDGVDQPTLRIRQHVKDKIRSMTMSAGIHNGWGGRACQNAIRSRSPTDSYRAGGSGSSRGGKGVHLPLLPLEGRGPEHDDGSEAVGNYFALSTFSALAGLYATTGPQHAMVQSFHKSIAYSDYWSVRRERLGWKEARKRINIDTQTRQPVLRFVTMASEMRDALQNLMFLAAFSGLELHVLGLEDGYGDEGEEGASRKFNYGDKIAAFYDHVFTKIKVTREWHSNDVIVLIDAYDVLLLPAARGIGQWVKEKARTPVTFCSEQGVYPEHASAYAYPQHRYKRIDDNIIHSDHDALGPRYLNSGCIAGRGKEILTMLQAAYETRNSHQNDQQFLVHYALAHPQIISLDRRGEIFMTGHRVQSCETAMVVGNDFSLHVRSATSSSNEHLGNHSREYIPMSSYMSNDNLGSIGVFHANNFGNNRIYHTLTAALSTLIQIHYSGQDGVYYQEIMKALYDDRMENVAYLLSMPQVQSNMTSHGGQNTLGDILIVKYASKLYKFFMKLAVDTRSVDNVDSTRLQYASTVRVEEGSSGYADDDHGKAQYIVDSLIAQSTHTLMKLEVELSSVEDDVDNDSFSLLSLFPKINDGTNTYNKSRSDSLWNGNIDMKQEEMLLKGVSSVLEHKEANIYNVMSYQWDQSGILFIRQQEYLGMRMREEFDKC